MRAEENEPILPEDETIDDQPHVFSVTDEEGNESHFAFYDEVKWEGNTYWICLHIPEGEDPEPSSSSQSGPEEEMDLYIFQAEEEEEGYVTLYDVEDQEELRQVADHWESLVQQEETGE